MIRHAFLLLAVLLAYTPAAAHAQGAVEARNGMVVAQ
jgi:hypothetical protein